MPDDHREKAAEAAARKLDRAYDRHEMTLQAVASDALQAADPHLQRMFFERFRGAMLSEGAQDAAAQQFHEWATWAEKWQAMIPAALDKAQEIMEGEDG